MRPSRYTHDLLIIGAGIGGLSVAVAALEADLKTIVVDRKRPGAGASGSPQALLNPATGRRAKKSWNARECLIRTRDLVDSVSIESGELLIAKEGVIRPPLDKKMSRKMKEEVMAADWPPGWVEWLDPAFAIDQYPSIPSVDGLLRVPYGCAVSMGRFVNALSLWLTRRGVTIESNTTLKNERLPDKAVSIQNQVISTPRHIVMATGQGLCNDPFWQYLPLHKVKGQVLELDLETPLPFTCSVSSLGYLAQGADPAGRIVIGSTYEHTFDHLLPDHQGEEYLLNRMSRTIPDLKRRIISSRGWAGVRVTTPDKKPFIGRHPEVEQMFGLGGLGSKGLMMGPMLGKLLVEHIINESNIPQPFRIERLLNKQDQ